VVRTTVLGLRELNRATLARQLLLERAELSASAAIERLVGMQAQIPTDPYIGLWARLRGFRPEALSDLIERRRAVRIHLMRWTIHLASARDVRLLRPTLQPMLDQRLRTGSPFWRAIDGIDRDQLVTAGRRLVDERPLTLVELGARLQERWPDHDAGSMARAVVTFVPVVQPPPRGTWGRSGQATWISAATWLGRTDATEPAPDAMVIRYLTAFGPASVMDAQAWCGLTRLGEVVDRLRPKLRVFRDEGGRELFDPPRAPRPDPDVPAPVRFLPVYDNVLLGHADRTRVLPDASRASLFGGDPIGNVGSVLVDGLVRATWRLDRGADRATIQVEPLARLFKEDRASIEAEGVDLLELLAPDAARRDVRIVARARRSGG